MNQPMGSMLVKVTATGPIGSEKFLAVVSPPFCRLGRRPQAEKFQRKPRNGPQATGNPASARAISRGANDLADRRSYEAAWGSMDVRRIGRTRTEATRQSSPAAMKARV